tara:strand:- start:5394 stop:6287 length:894 start_codon:yes stop_codon:yes gene_type:complete
MNDHDMTFFPGLHQPSDAKNFDRCFVSINRLRDRKSDFEVGDWILDSGAFTELTRTGYFRSSVAEYAAQIARWSRCGRLLAACSQDYMCEPFMFEGQQSEAEWREEMIFEGASPAWFDSNEFEFDSFGVADHQSMTVERFGQLVSAVRSLGCQTYVMPVLQGYAPADYVTIIDLYEEAGHLPFGAWVGVGSVCKRNSNADSIVEVLEAIRSRRPDLRLHGFGLKQTALENPRVVQLLSTSDSMAWSDAARKMRNRKRKAGWSPERVAELPSQNDWRTAAAYESEVNDIISGGQLALF